MTHFMILFTVLLTAYLSAATPLNRERELVNGPSLNLHGARLRRSEQYVKGKVPLTRTEHPLQLKVRKGEYVCGNKVCKLKPGEKPPGCGDTCQYPIL